MAATEASVVEALLNLNHHRVPAIPDPQYLFTNIISESSASCSCNDTNPNDCLGGGVYMEGNSTLSMSDCGFTGNQSTNGNGGAVYTYWDTVLTAENCTFDGNLAVGGGAMELTSDEVLTNCTFTNNTAEYAGGALYMGEWNMTPTLTGCTFMNNTSKYYTGGARRGVAGTRPPPPPP